jgi:hypothetical protein
MPLRCRLARRLGWQRLHYLTILVVERGRLCERCRECGHVTAGVELPARQLPFVCAWPRP